MAEDKRACDIVKAYDAGMNELASFRSLVQTCARYFKPTYGDLTTDPQESEVALPNTSICIDAQQKLCAGIYSNTISLGRGVLESEDPLKRDMEDVSRYYGFVGEKTNDIVRYGFPSTYREAIDDYGLTGVGIYYVHYNDKTGEHEFTSYNPCDCVWYEDTKGNVSKFMRGFEYTADQAVEKFGYENVSEKIRKCWDDESKADEKFKFIHCVRPRKERNKKRLDKMNMPYEDIYVEADQKKIVKEGGLRRMRYVVFVMFKRRGLRTGYSPAMHSLPSARTLVRGIDDFYDAIEFRTNPVMFMNDRESVSNARSLAPGDVRYARLSETPFLYGQNGDPATVDAMNEHLRDEITTLHFLDLFNALEDFKTGERTAYEVAQIIAEKVHLIAPVIHPLKDKCFAPLFEIVAEDIIEHGLIEQPIPSSLMEGDGDRFRVVYTSRIDSRMSGIETENLMFAIQEMAQAETMLSQTTHTQAIIKIEDVLNEIRRRRNLESSLTRSSIDYQKEMERLEQKMMEMAQQQANIEAASRRDVQAKPEEGSEQEVVERAMAKTNV